MMGLDTGQILFLVEIFFDSGILVWQDLPDFRADDVESHWGLQVRLIELGEDSVGEIWFELCVQILLLVNVDEATASTSVIVVFVAILNGNVVFSYIKFGHIQQNKPFFVVQWGLLTVDDDFGDVLTLQIDGQLSWDFGQSEGKFWETVVVSAWFEVDVKIITDGSLLKDSVSCLCSFLG